jgi:hypothetical protein
MQIIYKDKSTIARPEDITAGYTIIGIEAHLVYFETLEAVRELKKNKHFNNIDDNKLIDYIIREHAKKTNAEIL